MSNIILNLTARGAAPNAPEPTAPPRPPFKLAGLASIKHLNVRKEGPEDDKILAVDVKLSFSGVDRRLCGYFDDALESFLWRGDTDALIVRNNWIAPVAYGNEITGAFVKIGMREFAGCDVKKFSLYPTSADVSDLAKLVQDEDQVSIEGPADLFDVAVVTAPPVTAPNSNEPDPMYGDAIQVVVENGKASISLVQRHLRIGYNRAARIIEDMEKSGLVSAMAPDGSRKVLVDA